MKKLRKFVKNHKFLKDFAKSIRHSLKKIKYSKVYNNSDASMGKLSYNDEMFQGDLKHYLSVGESAMQNITEAIQLAGTNFGKINSVLDLPCGHGRVTRHLLKYIPGSKITACELDTDAIKFCSEEFGCIPLASNLDFKKINFPTKYDLIWVGSLFTHLNKQSFSKLLEVLYENLNSKGILVFTTHGEHSLSLLGQYGVSDQFSSDEIKRIYEKEHFFYTPYEANSDYGLSLSKKELVLELVNNISNGNLKLLQFKFKGWDNHQDVYSFIKS